MNKKILICTGGTGGHVIPAINLGNYFIKKGYKCKVILDQRGKKYSDNFKGQIKDGTLKSKNFSSCISGKNYDPNKVQLQGKQLGDFYFTPKAFTDQINTFVNDLRDVVRYEKSSNYITSSLITTENTNVVNP